MSGSYSIDILPAGFIRIRLAGFFDQARFDAFARELRTGMSRLTCPANAQVTLVDVTACSLQSQQMVERFTALLIEPRYESRRLAFVVGGSPARMQVRRVASTRANLAMFEDPGEAEAWLRQPDARAAA